MHNVRMRVVLSVVVAPALATVLGCASMAKLVSYERGGTFDMPDVTRLGVEAAKDKLAVAGITGSVDIVDNYVCDDEQVAVGDVCTTSPRPGNGRSARTPTTLYTRPAPTAAPMPDVIGKTTAEAHAILARGGFTRVEVEQLDARAVPEGCAPRTICRTSPPAGQGQGFKTITVLYAASAKSDDVELEGGTARNPVKPVKPNEPKPPDEPKPPPPAEPIF